MQLRDRQYDRVQMFEILRRMVLISSLESDHVGVVTDNQQHPGGRGGCYRPLAQKRQSEKRAIVVYSDPQTAA
jgi:hypothetical protein